MTPGPLVGRLFDEFVEAHVSGRQPDVRAFLLRADTAADELGVLIDRYLEVAPVQPADEETKVALHARLEHVTPLVAARRRLPMKVDEIVERLREALGLRGSLRPRLRAAYQELETGQLDPAGVNERVWEALYAILGLDPCRLVRYEPPVAAPAFFRAAEFEAGRAGAVASAHREAEPDEVDRLFRARLP